MERLHTRYCSSFLSQHNSSLSLGLTRFSRSKGILDRLYQQDYVPFDNTLHTVPSLCGSKDHHPLQIRLDPGKLRDAIATPSGSCTLLHYWDTVMETVIFSVADEKTWKKPPRRL